MEHPLFQATMGKFILRNENMVCSDLLIISIASIGYFNTFRKAL